MALVPYTAAPVPLTKKRWEDITQSDILVKERFVETERPDMPNKYVREYWRMGKKNDKSAWLTRCDEWGNWLEMGSERVKRSEIPRKVISMTNEQADRCRLILSPASSFP